ncbi:hypothetical protein ACWDG1_05100 [Streptomyces sp. NPDC001177]
MRWWTGAWWVAGVIVLAACGGPGGGGSSGGSSGGPSTGPSGTGSGTASPASGAPTRTTAPPAGTASGTPATSSPSAAPSASAGGCAAGHTQVTVAHGDAPVRRLCARPGTVVSLVLEPRTDDRRWSAVHSSAPAFVLPSGWHLDPDGTARASLRCAGTRGGTAKVTATAKAPDVAGAPAVAFTLDLSVVPYPREG